MKENLLRQLKDIQIFANSLLKEELTPEKIESFYRYSRDVKSYIIKNIDDELIKKTVLEIPDEELKNLIRSGKAVQFFNFDLIGLFKKSKKTDDAKDLIYLAKNKYASIEILLKNKG